MPDNRERVDRARSHYESVRDNTGDNLVPMYFLLVMAFLVIILGGLSVALFGFGLLT